MSCCRCAFLLLLAACTGDLNGHSTIPPPGDDDDGDEADAAPVTGSELTVTLRLERSGYYVSADAANAFTADRPSAGADETFTLVDVNRGELTSGDVVAVRSSRGAALLGETTFTIVRRDGEGPIVSGDVVGLQASTSRWVSAQNGGGGPVAASGESLRTWEAIVLTVGAGAGGWKLVWSDEFNSPQVDGSKWAYEVKGPGWVNHELQNYTDQRGENARVEDGHLIIEARRDNFEGKEYSSARLKTAGKASWTYGRVEARLQLPAGRGTWPAFWMMPDDFHRGWPACGEIDIMEHVGYDLDKVHATTHSEAYNWKRPEQRTSTIAIDGATTRYHVYTIEWDAEKIDASVDGVKYFTSANDHTGDDAWPFDKNFYVILNLAVGGDWGAVKGVDAAAFPQRMLVDWVRVYQK